MVVHLAIHSQTLQSGLWLISLRQGTHENGSWKEKNRDKNGEEMQEKDEFDQKYIINIYEISNNILKYCI